MAECKLRYFGTKRPREWYVRYSCGWERTFNDVSSTWMPPPTCPQHGPNGRPDWAEYFLGIAEAVAARADCRRAKHGAVIVKDRRIVSTGYNGGPAGGASCLAGECPRGLLSYDELPGHAQGNHDYSSCVAIHAEANALVYANRADTEGATIYITGKPCDGCAKLIAASGITATVHP